MTANTNGPDIEAELADAFAAPIPVLMRASIDRRVAAAIQAQASRWPMARPWFRPRARFVAVATTAALLVAGTVLGATTLLSRLADSSAFLEHVWDRSAPVGLTATDAGYTITLERAAYDAGARDLRSSGDDRDRFWIALTTTAESGVPVVADDMTLQDSEGHTLSGGVGAVSTDRHSLALMYAFAVPSGTTLEGPYTLRITTVRAAEGPDTIETDGPWVFKFGLP
jgi:hypothetical protein